MSRTNQWIVIGAGASGLAAAFFLKQHGMEPVIVERERSIGGRMGSVRLGERSLDFVGSLVEDDNGARCAQATEPGNSVLCLNWWETDERKPVAVKT